MLLKIQKKENGEQNVMKNKKTRKGTIRRSDSTTTRKQGKLPRLQLGEKDVKR